VVTPPTIYNAALGVRPAREANADTIHPRRGRVVGPSGLGSLVSSPGGCAYVPVDSTPRCMVSPQPLVLVCPPCASDAPAATGRTITKRLEAPLPRVATSRQRAARAAGGCVRASCVSRLAGGPLALGSFSPSVAQSMSLYGRRNLGSNLDRHLSLMHSTQTVPNMSLFCS
jgi:hypothetical protein